MPKRVHEERFSHLFQGDPPFTKFCGEEKALACLTCEKGTIFEAIIKMARGAANHVPQGVQDVKRYSVAPTTVRATVMDPVALQNDPYVLLVWMARA